MLYLVVLRLYCIDIYSGYFIQPLSFNFVFSCPQCMHPVSNQRRVNVSIKMPQLYHVYKVRKSGHEMNSVPGDPGWYKERVRVILLACALALVSFHVNGPCHSVNCKSSSKNFAGPQNILFFHAWTF